MRRNRFHRALLLCRWIHVRRVERLLCAVRTDAIDHHIDLDVGHFDNCEPDNYEHDNYEHDVKTNQYNFDHDFDVEFVVKQHCQDIDCADVNDIDQDVYYAHYDFDDQDVDNNDHFVCSSDINVYRGRGEFSRSLFVPDTDNVTGRK